MASGSRTGLPSDRPPRRRAARSAWRSGDSAAMRAARSLTLGARGSFSDQTTDFVVGQRLDLVQQTIELVVVPEPGRVAGRRGVGIQRGGQAQALEEVRGHRGEDRK